MYQACAQWDECSFSISCPTRGLTELNAHPDPPCEQQAMMMMGLSGSMILCCFMFGLRRLQLKCRAPMQGKNVKINMVNIKADWVLHKATAEYTRGTGKKHIVWNHQEDIAAEWFEGGIVPADQCHVHSDPDLLITPFAGEDDVVEPSNEVILAGQDGMIELACPAYSEGAKIEYYSSSNKQWLPGVVHLSLVEGMHDVYDLPQGSYPEVIHNVMLAAT